jgi:hypothetical protein
MDNQFFIKYDHFTAISSEHIKKHANLMMLSLFAFLNAFTPEEERFYHMNIIKNFCIDILFRQIKNAPITVCIPCRDLLFQIQYQISLKLYKQNNLHQQNNGQFENPFGHKFNSFRQNVNSLIDLIQFLKDSNCVDIECNYDSVMISSNIKNSFDALLEDTLNVCNAEGVRAQIAMPNVVNIIKSM